MTEGGELETGGLNMAMQHPTLRSIENPAMSLLRDAALVARSTAMRYPRALAQSIRQTCVSESTPRFHVDLRDVHGPVGGVWLGHATVLLRVGERWVLTDPVGSDRIGFKLGRVTLGMGRMMPTFDIASLPPIDIILISHAHFDHLDKPTLRALTSRTTHVVTSHLTRRLIPRGFAGVHELHWDDELDLLGLKLRALRPNHWGARYAFDKHRGFNSYLMETPDRRRVLYAGDTAFTDNYKDINGAELCVFGIGAYDPWVRVHATPEQVWQMHRQAGGKFLLPMHHSTFKLSDEPAGDPMRRLLAAAGEDHWQVVGRELGSPWTLPEALIQAM